MQCEICGSENIIKQEGVYICQSCGTKYSVEEARKMTARAVEASSTEDTNYIKQAEDSDELLPHEKSIEVFGATEEAAIDKALEQINRTRNEVSIEILERAKSGFLGIGASPARIRVTYQTYGDL